MIGLYALVFLSTALGVSSKIYVPCMNGVQYFKNGDNIHLSCFFSPLGVSASSWLKQAPGAEPLLIATAVHPAAVDYKNGLDNITRIQALRNERSFNMSITNAEPSDSATYYCAVTHYSNLALSDCTVVVLHGSSPSLYTVLQTPVLDSVEVGGSTTLQCSILTDVSAGEHSVYWLRHGSGESPPGIIYTHGDTNSQCSRSSETDSPTQRCVYKLPKTNLSLSDAGTYYCAVAVCGQILFGNGIKLDLVGNTLVPVIVVLSASNIIFGFVVLFLCRKLSSSHQIGAAESYSVQVNKGSCDEDLNYAALSFTNNASSSKTARRQQKLTDTEVYSQVKHPK